MHVPFNPPIPLVEFRCIDKLAYEGKDTYTQWSSVTLFITAADQKRPGVLSLVVGTNLSHVHMGSSPVREKGRGMHLSTY